MGQLIELGLNVLNHVIPKHKAAKPVVGLTLWVWLYFVEVADEHLLDPMLELSRVAKQRWLE